MTASQFKQQNSTKTSILIIILFGLEKIVQQWIKKRMPCHTKNELLLDKYKIYVEQPRKFTYSEESAAYYAIIDEVKNE
jgi:hypothetical protein